MMLKRGILMKLKREEAELFYSLWFSMIREVNNAYGVVPKIRRDPKSGGVFFPDVQVVADFVWEHTDVIDEYLEEADLPNEHEEIIAGWKRRKRGTYIIERNLAKGSVFVSADDGSVYIVQGLLSSFEEMLAGWSFPVLAEATLLSFKGKIITDGLVYPQRIRFGRESIADFKDVYMDAKNKGKIIFSI